MGRTVCASERGAVVAGEKQMSVLEKGRRGEERRTRRVQEDKRKKKKKRTNDTNKNNSRVESGR